MKLAIRYEAHYRYETVASFSPHVARLFPRPDISLQIRRTRFSTNAEADIQYRRDLFDNLIASCFYPSPAGQLEYHLELDLEVAPQNPFHFLLAPYAVEMPFAYRAAELPALAPFLAPQAALPSLPAELDRFSQKRSTVEALLALVQWVHRNIAYERREEGPPHPPGQTLHDARGACRDFAVLFAELLRHHGIAARLVSGYLWEEDTPESGRRAENAFHAWTEAYLPGAGWVGFDPTNGVLCDHHAIACCVGLMPEDIAPISGHYYGNTLIRSTLESSLTISGP